MAIQKTITHKGIIINDAYGKIINLSGTKDKVTYTVAFFVNSELAQDDSNAFNSLRYSFVPLQTENSDRWDKQAYEHLKTLPEYVNAIDVLDEGQDV